MRALRYHELCSGSVRFTRLYRTRENKRMAAFAGKLTFAEFQSQYEHGDRSYEYWHGEAVPKGMPTWIHGLLQVIISQLLIEAGYLAGAEVELRIVPDAHPKSDVIEISGDIDEPY